MNAFNENPLFLFVDDLVDDSPNFAKDGKIVELFDTGCDARTPGAALKCSAKEHDDTPIQKNISTPRKPAFDNSVLRECENVVKKAADSSQLEDAKRNITDPRKSVNENKPMNSNCRKGNALVMKSNENEVKNCDNLVHDNSSCIKASKNSNRGGVIPEEQKAKKLSPNRTWLSAKYDETNRTVKSTLLQKYKKTPKVRTTICETLEGKSGSIIRSATNPSTISPPETSKVISEASLDYGVTKLVDRAVDKDSLSNCSRQFEVRKTSGAPFHSKSNYTSRLPRSSRVAKTFCKNNSDSGVYKSNGTGELKALTNSELKIAPMKIVASTEQKLDAKSLESTKVMDVSLKTRNNDGKAESSTKTVQSNKLGSKNSPTRIAVSIARAPSSTRTKIAASKMQLPRLNRNLFTGGKVKPSENRGEGKANEYGGRMVKPNEKVSSKISFIDDVTRPQDSGDKKTGGRPEKAVLAPPSLESCNLISCNNDLKNEVISFKTKLPKPRTPLIVPKLMNEFRLLDKKQNEASKSSSRDLPVFDSSLSSVVETKKSKTESIIKPCSSSEVLNKEISERLSRFSNHLQEALDSGIPLPSGRGVRESNKVKRQEIRDERSKPKEEKNVKIGLKTKFIDTKSTSRCKATPQSSMSLSGARKIKESNPKQSSFVKPSATRNLSPSPSVESKVPRPIVAKRNTRKEIAPLQNSSVAKTRPQRQTHQGVSKNLNKAEARNDVRPSLLPATKPAESHNAESVEVSETSAVLKEDSDEDVIPIMNPALCNRYPVSPRDRESKNTDNVPPHKTIRYRGKLASWIDGHEQAYLKGRAIGLRVASMARAAKEISKRELIKTSPKINAVNSRPNKSQEIVEIGVSLIEKVIAEKENKNHSPSVGGDQPSNYVDFYENSKWNDRQWLI